MRLRVIVAALLGGLAILSSTIAASAKDELKPRKILRAWMVEMSWNLDWGKILWENWVPPTQP